jgi:hypothetical protein
MSLLVFVGFVPRADELILSLNHDIRRSISYLGRILICYKEIRVRFKWIFID